MKTNSFDGGCLRPSFGEKAVGCPSFCGWGEDRVFTEPSMVPGTEVSNPVSYVRASRVGS